MTVLRVLAGLLVFSAPSLAQAESWPSEVSELRVVVPKAQGKRSWGRDSITSAVRKTMAEAIKPVSANQLLKAQKKLRLRGSRARSDDGMARAGNKAGADYVLDIKITKKKWLYTATARLINTESGEEQMNFRSQYYKPAREGKDRGYRIAKRTIEKLAQLVNEGDAPKGGGAVADSGDSRSDSGDATGQRMDDGSGSQATASNDTNQRDDGRMDDGNDSAANTKMDDGNDASNTRMDDGNDGTAANTKMDDGNNSSAANTKMDDGNDGTTKMDDGNDGTTKMDDGNDGANNTRVDGGGPGGTDSANDGSSPNDGAEGSEGSGPFGTEAPAPTPRRTMVFNIPKLAPNSDRLDQPDPVRELMREGFEQPAPAPAPAPVAAVATGAAAVAADDPAMADPGGPGPVEPNAGDPAATGSGPWGTDATGTAGPTAVEPGAGGDPTAIRMDDEPVKEDPTNMRMDDEPTKTEPAKDQAANQDAKGDDAKSGENKTDDAKDGEAKTDDKTEESKDKGAATSASGESSLASNTGGSSSDSSRGNTGSGNASSGNTGSGSSFTTSNTSGGTDGVVATRVAPVNDDTELLRFSVGAGSGLIRTYALRSAAVARSGLSYNLLPLSLFQGSAELIVPKVPVFWKVRGAFRPVGYEVDPGVGTPVEASGWLIDADTTVGYHIPLAGSGRQAVRLSPGVGARLTRSSVSDTASDVLLSSTLVAVIGQLGLRLPVNSVLEIEAAVDGGYIPVYSESPLVTGDSGSGFTVGGDLGARIWLSNAIGIAIDNRFTYERVDFGGAPSRNLPMSEVGALTDATVTTRDLRTAFSVAVRL